MSESDPDRPAMVHDRLNDEMFEWLPERHGRDNRRSVTEFDFGVISWGKPIKLSAATPPGFCSP